MSTKYPGGIISKTAPTPSGPYSTDTAPGVWTLEQQAYWQKLGQWPTQGNVPLYIEDVFSTYLYTGNGSTQTITNGIDLAGDGGLVWTKARVTAGFGNELTDTVRGAGLRLISNTTGAQGGAGSSDTTGFTSSGFQLTFNNGLGNLTGENYASWTFREQPKFFDIVTYTGNGVDGRQLPHNLGSTPGCVMFKRTDSTGRWITWHRSLPINYYLQLQDTAAQQDYTKSLTPDATNLTLQTVSNSAYNINESGATYVAYVFAHDAGGFGLTGTDNVITCGSFTTDGSGNATVSLGYEPQWVLQKIASGGITSGVDDWKLLDTMRGFTNPSSGDVQLKPNTSDAEQNTSWGVPTATGFTFSGFANATYIYIAIRRGPMKVPTSGTSVFKPLYEAGTGSARTVNAGFPTDLFFIKDSTGLTGPTAGGNVFYDRLRGNSNVLQTQSTAAEAVSGTYTALFNSVQNGVVVSDYWSSYAYREYCFQRAPSFFDEVCYTGNGAGANNQTHNLGVMPEMCILRRRDSAVNWQVVHQAAGTAKTLALNLTNSSLVNSTMSANFTSTYFKTADGTCWFEGTNGNTFTYVAYLFATCAGVSKVGSYTGTATTLQIDCGFTGGARFVMIKRTDDVGDWYVWDSARGIVSGNDPYLLLNSTAAEVTNTDYVDTYSAGFEISSTAPSAINASGGTFIFLAIA